MYSNNTAQNSYQGEPTDIVIFPVYLGMALIFTDYPTGSQF